MANLHRSLNQITTKSKRKSFTNIFKFFFSPFILTHLDVILVQIYHNFYNKFVYAWNINSCQLSFKMFIFLHLLVAMNDKPNMKGYQHRLKSTKTVFKFLIDGEYFSRGQRYMYRNVYTCFAVFHNTWLSCDLILSIWLKCIHHLH